MWVVIIGGALGLTSAVYMFNKPNKSMNSLKAELAIEAEALVKDYSGSESEANETYLGKIVEISGPVVLISTSQDGSISFSLFDPFEGVTATFKAEYVKENKSRIHQIEQGDNITVKGRCDGMLTDVRISDCVFAE